MTKKICLIVTSHNKMGDLDKQTGWYLPEVAHPWHEFNKKDYKITFASPKGGLADCDNGSVESFKNDQVCQDFTKKFLNDKNQLETVKSDTLNAKDFDVVFYAGGHGVMWDFPDNEFQNKFAADIYANNGVVSAVCHGPAALVNIKLSNGDLLIKNKTLCGFTNDEEEAVGLTKAMPFLLETVLKEKGGNFVKADNFKCNVQVDGRLVTGQNPASATKTATEIIKILSDNNNEEKKGNEEKNSESVILVTGGNKGLGLALVELLLTHKNITVILGCRGWKSVPKLDTSGKRKDPAKFELKGYGKENNKDESTRIELLREKFKGIKNIDFTEVDLLDEDSIKKSLDHIKGKYKQIDVLVNNAGMAWDDPDAFDINVVNKTFDVNYYGTKKLTEIFLPIIKKGGKILNISSRAGLLDKRIKDKKMQETLLSDDLTQKELDDIIAAFKQAVKDDKMENFDKSAYGTSKVALTAYGKILARKQKDEQKWVGSYCPGWCKTYMTGGKGNREVIHGAKGMEILCTKENLPTGSFWACEFENLKLETAYLSQINFLDGKTTKYEE